MQHEQCPSSEEVPFTVIRMFCGFDDIMYLFYNLRCLKQFFVVEGLIMIEKVIV